MPDSPTRRQPTRGGTPDPVCAVCANVVSSGSLVVFQHGELFHVRCISRDVQLRPLDEGDRAQEAKARAAETADRAARLLEYTQAARGSPSETSGPAKRLHRVIIVQRDRPEILPMLRGRFGAEATILFDRRGGERRRDTRSVKVKRRRGGERRRPLMEPEELLWRDAGYRIA